MLSLASEDCFNSLERNYGLTYSGNKFMFSGIPHIDTSMCYVGVSDNGNNTGYWVELWQNNVGITRGSAWCAAYVYSMLKLVNIEKQFIRSGQAQKYITKKSIKANDVFKGVVTVPAGSLVIWKKGETWKGHIGFNRFAWKGRKGNTIEGNTAPEDDSNGGYTMLRTRTIQPFNYFRITHFTLVRYD